MKENNLKQERKKENVNERKNGLNKEKWKKTI